MKINVGKKKKKHFTKMFEKYILSKNIKGQDSFFGSNVFCPNCIISCLFVQMLWSEERERKEVHSIIFLSSVRNLHSLK